MIQDQQTRESEVPWRDNSSFVTTFYAILTAMVGAILALAIGDKEIAASWYCPVGLLALSMILFIWGFEKCGDAVDENDVDKYLAWLLSYNFGSVAMFFGVATYIGLHYHSNWPLFAFIIIVATFASWKWLYDIGYLLFASAARYEAYREELLGNCPSEKERDWLMAAHGFFRGLHKHKNDDFFLPDSDCFTRLQPSPIHGVGVFVIRDIPKGTNIFKDDNSEMIWIDRKEVLRKSGEIRRLYDDFCVLNGEKYGCPEGFNNLTTAWYINEPPKGQEPNVVCGDDYDFFAARVILAGEELTVKYGTYSDDPESDAALSEAPRDKKG
jgi:hypothetical protein